MQAVKTDTTRVAEVEHEGAGYFTIKQTQIKRLEVLKGYGVVCVEIWGGDEEPDVLVDADTIIVHIDPSTTHILSDGVACIKVDHNFFVPVENFSADETDSWTADRWFPTLDEAEQHAAEINRWAKRMLPAA